MKRKYLLYDARARGAAGTDDAECLGMDDSLKEAHKSARELGFDCAIYSRAVEGSPEVLNDEQWEEDYLA